ncbi:MAG: hypothetical protein HOH33_01175 [Verrucomicrobia bacterium]|jgi:lysophospholipase L1-like esterase|nr:hypothetical protein [Verrucomicrobiota bacterium]
MMISHDALSRAIRVTYLSWLSVFLCLSSAQKGKAQGSERWEKNIATYEESDQQNPPPKNGVLFIGSSSIRKWDSLAADFPDKHVINRGFGGSEIPDSIHFFERIVQPYQPSVIVLYAGDNDIGGGHTPEEVFENFKIFAGLVKQRLPKSKLVFIAIKPSLKRWNLAPEMEKANRKIRQYALWHRRVLYADIWNPMLGVDSKPRPELFIQDGLHLSAKGYFVWTQVIAGKL